MSRQNFNCSINMNNANNKYYWLDFCYHNFFFFLKKKRHSIFDFSFLDILKCPFLENRI